MRRGQFADMTAHDHEMRQTVADIEHSMADIGVQLHPPMSYQYDAPAAQPPLEISEVEKPKKPRAPRKPRLKAAPKVPAEATEGEA